MPLLGYILVFAMGDGPAVKKRMNAKSSCPFFSRYIPQYLFLKGGFLMKRAILALLTGLVLLSVPLGCAPAASQPTATQPQTQNNDPQPRIRGAMDFVDPDSPDAAMESFGSIASFAEGKITINESGRIIGEGMPLGQRPQHGGADRPALPSGTFLTEPPEGSPRPMTQKTYIVAADAVIKLIDIQAEQAQITAGDTGALTEDAMVMLWLSDRGEVHYIQVITGMAVPGEGFPDRLPDASPAPIS